MQRMGDLPFKCPKRQKLYNEFIKTPKGILLDQKYKEWYNYVSKHTGLNVTSVLDLALLYFGLATEHEFGYKLPSWVKPVYPKILKSSVVTAYILSSATPNLAKLGQGFLLKTMLDVSTQKIEGTINPIGRKFMLFSGHEHNVAGFLMTLKAFDNDVPTYGSCVMVELHKIKNEYGFKIYYEKFKGGPPTQIIIPGCEHFCTINKIRELLHDRIPESYDLCFT